ncbi:MAG: PTS sugar transporter subunit IIA [Gemmatimonadetes bacterium]|nr:PTS sugar transporter subunit IIA [Gemmatimonadota bacterium]
MLLTDLLTPERIKIPLVANDKDALLRELVGLVGDGGKGADPEQILTAVREREEVLSTGIGNGVAIPHGKTSSVDRLMLAAGVATDGVDFEALDGKPVQLFFLLVGPESAAGDHVKALSRISRLLQRDTFRTRLASATHPDEFYAIVSEAETT